LWREVAFDFSGMNLTAQIYQQDTGEKVYRRGMYTFWKRTAPPPVMLLFDAPDRERCVVRRERTNTPLQALALMNDPTFVEASGKLAERMIREAGPYPADRIAYGFRLLTARRPTFRELEPLTALFDRQVDRLSVNPEIATALSSTGESPHDPAIDTVELAAYALIANVLLNLDETITKQ
jgi:hypothetical protein